MLVVRDVELVLVEFLPKDGAAPFARTQNQAGPQKDRTGQDQMHQPAVYPPRGVKTRGSLFGPRSFFTLVPSARYLFAILFSCEHVTPPACVCEWCPVVVR